MFQKSLLSELQMAKKYVCLISVWKQSKTYLLKERGHIHELTAEEKKMIVDFLIEYDKQ